MSKKIPINARIVIYKCEQQQLAVGKTTISIGIVSISPLFANNVDEVISAADKILYEAKRAGKNQVRSWQFN